MPARKIKRSYVTVTGSIASDKNGRMTGFEGLLEYEFMQLLEFDWDDEIESFEEQPVTIAYRDPITGRDRTYTPDVLVRYKDGRRPCLFEVKPRSRLREQWLDLRPKFRAALRYARRHGLRFKIVTEKEIETPFLENAKFLREYRDVDVDSEGAERLLSALDRFEECTPDVLLKSLTGDRWHQAGLLPTLWALVARKRVAIDIHKRLTMASSLWAVSR